MNEIPKKSRKERDSRYYQANKDRIKDYWSKNKERFRERRRKYFNNKYKNDINHRLALLLRSRLRLGLKNSQKRGSAIKDLGCSIEELKLHLEKQFQENMSWDNYGKGYGKWQIDHIKPLISFDLNDTTQFLNAVHYTNLRPLWYQEHSQKSSKERRKK